MRSILLAPCPVTSVHCDEVSRPRSINGQLMSGLTRLQRLDEWLCFWPEPSATGETITQGRERKAPMRQSKTELSDRP
ncbi:hypothetical protein RRG08_024598 [Elysia crispata]|uniref:Uncharacterized protein n=1 Tax=Elysia crispata TaxID=231223 RepID=A0AAE1DN24_9GAST|nr:hypothetical protein RRG08_024598 [Elysia crispata]